VTNFHSQTRAFIHVAMLVYQLGKHPCWTYWPWNK